MIEARRRAAKALAIVADDTPSPSLSRVRPGMVVLAKRARQQSDDAFETFRAAWDQDRLAVVAHALDGLIDALEQG
jgi:nicotinamide mononucleotide (NMN) deamidase PncC